MKNIFNGWLRSGLSFRLKLVMAMTLLAVTVALGAVFWAKQALGQVYRGFLREQFDQEVERFQEKELARLAPILQKVQTALDSIRLIAALDAGDEERFYSDLRYELRHVENTLQSQPYIRFINRTGEVLHPREAGFDPDGNFPPEQLDRISQALSTAVEQLGHDVGLGYLPVRNLAREELFFRVMTAPFEDPYTGRLLGLLVLAVPMPQVESVGEREGKRIKSGLLAGGSLYSSNMLSRHKKDLLTLLKRYRQKEGDVAPELDIHGVPHRAYFQKLVSLPGLPEVYQVTLFSLKAFYQLLREVQVIVLAFGILAVLFGIILSLLMSHQIARPLTLLSKGVEEVQKGNLEVQVEVRSRDEFGRLGQAFNRMTEGLALKEKYRSVLGKVTDPGVAEALISGKLALGGELREASILFCDIRSFTAMTEQKPPEEVVEMLNEHMTALTRVSYEYGGVVDKFVGDEIMVLFGVPAHSPKAADNAAACACAMMQERQKLNEKSHWSFEIGIGIATGEVLAGCMGSEDRLNYTVLGERVNLAARLCAAAAPGQVLIDPVTSQLLSDSFSFNPAAPISLKGFSRVMQPYSLVAPRSMPVS